MYEVKIDKMNNRLYLKLSGFLNNNELKQVAEETKQNINLLRPNFDIINDITDFKPTTQSGRELVKDVMAFAIQARVKRVVRILDHLTIGSMQFNRASKEIGYTALYAKSYQEALALLADN
ncbi:MAG: hypothetical protein ACXAC7_08685 [Candidatus Hodarchaeales archaeon]|jgi:hypothetical protein